MNNLESVDNALQAEGFFFLIFVAIILFNIFKGSNPITKNTPKGWSGSAGAGGAAGMASKTASAVLRNATKAGAAKSTYDQGRATLEKIEHERRRLKHKAMSNNKDLFGKNKNRVDSNRNRRTDWGARGQPNLFSPQMLAILFGLGVTLFYALRFFAKY